MPLFWGASLIRRVSRGSEALWVGWAREDGRGEEQPGVIKLQSGQQHKNIAGQRDFTKGEKGHLFWHLRGFLLKVSFCWTSSFPQNSNWTLSFPQKYKCTFILDNKRATFCLSHMELDSYVSVLYYTIRSYTDMLVLAREIQRKKKKRNLSNFIWKEFNDFNFIIV